MTKNRLMPKGHWQYPESTPFSQGWRVDDLIFVGGQGSLDARGNVVHPESIEMQTRLTLQNVRRVLKEAGADVQDIVKLTTFYVVDEQSDVEEIWAKIARVRTEFFSAPGPCSTAIPVRELGLSGMLIEVEAVAVMPSDGRE